MTSLYQKILVPYDFSLPSCHALDQAMRIAKLCRSENSIVKVFILYVLEEIHLPPSFDYGMKITPPGIETISSKEHLKKMYHELKMKTIQLLSERTKNLETKGISIVTQVLVGKPNQQIKDFAFSEKVDLIVVGAISLKGIQKIKTLGSVSRKIAEEAKCPVMIVH